MSPRKPIDRIKFGFVSGRRVSDAQWELRWRTPEGNDCKRRIPAESREDALNSAIDVNRDISAGKHIPGMRRAKTGLSVRDAIVNWIAGQPGLKDKTAADYLVALNDFNRYLVANARNVSQWNEIQRKHFERYFSTLESLSRDTQRRRLVVIRKMAKDMHLADEELYPNFMAKARVTLKESNTDEKPHPSDRQLLHLLEWFHRRYPTLWAQLVLEAGAGLRGFEACFLRVCDVDLVKGILRLEPTEAYQLKNKGSKRTIPLTKAVVACLKEYLAGCKVQSVSGDAPLFLNHHGRPWTESGICTSRTKAMAAYRTYLDTKGLPPLPECFKLRELRSVFATMAIRAGVSELLLQRYIGHSAGTVLRKHYLRITEADLRVGVIDKLEHRLEAIWNRRLA